MNVTVTNDGRLQLNVDGLMTPPLSVEAVQALAAAIPDAQAAAGRQTLTDAVHDLTDLLAVVPTLTGTVEITSAGTILAHLSADAFAAAAQAWGVTPNENGALVHGPATVYVQESVQ
jgi:hypothetical protein